jgi:hypothetical protein
MFIDTRSQKIFSAPSGAAYALCICRSSGARELFSHRSYKHRAPLALARCPAHKIRCGQELYIKPHKAYSNRSSTAGSDRAARRAGKPQASAAAIASTATTIK